MTDRFYLKSGELTRYAFACGYIEKWTNRERGIQVTLEGEPELSCFHVRVHSIKEGRLSWDSFATNELTKARRLFHMKVREHKGGL